MSFLRSSPPLPRHTVMRFSPWFLVGSALILALAIGFWAVKNAHQERENLSRNMLDRAGALIWAMEGSARVGMGFRSTAAHLQFMLEETAKQPGIVYMAIITEQGQVLAHSDRSRIGSELHPPEYMAGLSPAPLVHWRIFKPEGAASSVFEAFKFFNPLPGFRDHMRHVGKGADEHGRGMRHGRRPRTIPPDPSEAFAPPAESQEGPVPGPPGKRRGMGRLRPAPERNELIIVIGLDMKSFEDSLAADLRSTVFTALLVGLLGLGGFLSLFWAQNYRFSRRLLQDTRAFADKIVSSLPMGLVVVSPSGLVMHSNGAAESLLGCGDSALIGRHIKDLEGMDWPGLAQRVRDAEAGQGGAHVLEEEQTLLLPPAGGTGAGREVPVSVSASRILNEQGESLGIMFLLRDLREVKRLQEELRRSERLSTLGNMAARVAHEIRNPLSSIKGFATFLGATRDSDADKEAARTMIGEVDRLNRVVSELLDFARPSNLNIATADIVAVVQRAVRLVEPDAVAKGVSVSLESPDQHMAGGADIMAAVDAERITQVLLNLLLNAVQATDAGGAVCIRVVPPGDDGMVYLHIEDTGRGMGPEVLSQIFQPYFTTKASGTGLGLSIAAKIVEDHKGAVKVASTPGEGTVVSLHLPAADAHHAVKGESHA